MSNTFASSEKLKEIQGQQPGKYELTQKLKLILDQYGVTPKMKEIIETSRIPSLANEAEELAKLTGDQLAALRIETMVTTRMTAYESGVEEILRKMPKAINNIMNQDWPKVA